ncbi:transmembrane protein 220-like [Glandiceps talaboti]
MPDLKNSQEPLEWKLVNLFLAGLFSLFAYVQKNDPDPEIWIAVYLIPAMLCFVLVISANATSNPIWRVASLLHIIGICVFTLYQMKIIMNSTTDQKFYEMEEARELGGLFFATAWLLICRNSEESNYRFAAYIGMIITAIPIILWIGIAASDEYRASVPEHCKTVMYPEKSEV